MVFPPVETVITSICAMFAFIAILVAVIKALRQVWQNYQRRQLNRQYRHVYNNQFAPRVIVPNQQDAAPRADVNETSL